MEHVFKRDENKEGEILELTESPFNSNHFAIKNATIGEYTSWSEIGDYAEAHKKFRFLVEKEKNDIWQG